MKEFAFASVGMINIALVSFILCEGPHIHYIIDETIENISYLWNCVNILGKVFISLLILLAFIIILPTIITSVIALVMAVILCILCTKHKKE